MLEATVIGHVVSVSSGKLSNGSPWVRVRVRYQDMVRNQDGELERVEKSISCVTFSEATAASAKKISEGSIVAVRGVPRISAPFQREGDEAPRQFLELVILRINVISGPASYTNGTNGPGEAPEQERSANQTRARAAAPARRSASAREVVDEEPIDDPFVPE